jgi:hypothetical protein
VTTTWGRRALGLLAAALVFLPAAPAAAADPDREIAYTPYLHSTGWGAQKRNGDIAGTMNPLGDRVDAWEFYAVGAGQLCVEAHLADFGWQNERCADTDRVEAGAPGWGYNLDGLSWRTATGKLCIKFQVVLADQQVIWAGPYCAETQRSAVEWPGGRITALSMWYA